MISSCDSWRGIVAALSIAGAVQALWAQAAMGTQASSRGVLNAPSRGASNASATLIVFEDFECFKCARSSAVFKSVLQAHTALRVVFKSAPAKSNKNAFLAHEAAMAAHAQGKFWEMHDLLFASQQNLQREDLITYTRKLGLDIGEFTKALDDHRFRGVVESDLAEAQGLGVTSTPTFFLNGRRLVGPQGEAAITAVVDSVFAGMRKEAEAELMAASGPAQSIDLENAPGLGPGAASVNIVEFSDFECPFCAQTSAVIRQVVEAYPTQVRLSFKHYPLPFHRESPLAHEAALAAGAQGKFWEMHDLLFTTQDKLSRDDLLTKAKQLRLDVPRFTKDLDSRRLKPLVDADRREGERLGVDGTPFFFINGRAVSGAVGFAELKRIIDAALKEAVVQAK